MSTGSPSPVDRPSGGPAARPEHADGATEPAPLTPAETSARRVRDEAFFDPAVAHLPELRRSHLAPEATPAERRLMLPVMLFLATCASTFWVGASHWEPLRPDYAANWANVAATIRINWLTGLQYMTAVLAILLTHEMGHFLQTVRYGIPASYPLCIPVPFNAIGTMGAVIGMDGMRADRRQIFDIGLAGPLAGLVVAFPVLWFGIKRLDLSAGAGEGELEFYLPLVAQWMMHWAHPGASWAGDRWVALSELNPLFMAGWVGMLITGLNMLPISQLDGGHTIYALFLDRSYALARLFISFAILYVVVNLDEAVLWTPMLLLVIFLGIHHPPTANDRVELGPVRRLVGLASLAIPVLCFPLMGVR